MSVMSAEISCVQTAEETCDSLAGEKYGYFTIMKKAGRNRYHQQLFIVRCDCCNQFFTKTLHKIREADGKNTCRHTKRTTRPATEPHPCAYCGEMTTNLKYCSNTCKTTDVNIRTKTKPPKLCLLCGQPTPNRNSTLCSAECRRLHRLKSMYGFAVGQYREGGIVDERVE